MLKDSYTFDASLLFAFLDGYLRTDSTASKDKSRLEPKLVHLLSDLAANNELLAAARQHSLVCERHGKYRRSTKTF